MMNSLKDEEKRIITEKLTEYVNRRCNLKQYNEYIQNNFSSICQKNESNWLEIINDFYMNNDNYKIFKNYLENNNLDEYINDNFKKILLISDEDCQYHIGLNNIYINKDNFVKNGSLVFKINRILDYNTEIKKRLTLTNQLDDYLKKIEKEMSTTLYVDVRILYKDIIIPPKF